MSDLFLPGLRPAPGLEFVLECRRGRQGHQGSEQHSPLRVSLSWPSAVIHRLKFPARFLENIDFVFTREFQHVKEETLSQCPTVGGVKSVPQDGRRVSFPVSVL